MQQGAFENTSANTSLFNHLVKEIKSYSSIENDSRLTSASLVDVRGVFRDVFVSLFHAGLLNAKDESNIRNGKN